MEMPHGKLFKLHSSPTYQLPKNVVFQKAYQTPQLPYFEVKASKALTFMISRGKKDSVTLIFQCGITAVPSLSTSTETPMTWQS